MMMSVGDPTQDALTAGLDAWGFAYSEHQIEQFLLYRDLLIECNATRMNLTRITSPTGIAVEHFLDSLALLTVLKISRGASVLDVGAGAGFPSLPLMVMRPDLRVTLLEATAKKLTFCRTVVDALGLQDIRAVHGRAENCPELRGETFDLVTARAVTRLPQLVEWCEPYVRRDTGILAALKGAQADDELAEAQPPLRERRLRGTLRIVDVPGSDKTHAIVICSRASLRTRQ
jgi:16S rRNA (guanine(527)-N(7))-methyltransferase RsmG